MEATPAISIDNSGIRESGTWYTMSRHFVKHLIGFLKEGLTAKNTNENGMNVFIGAAPGLALHVLEEAEGALPVATAGEFLEDNGEVREGETIAEGFKAASDATARGKATELVD